MRVGRVVIGSGQAPHDPVGAFGILLREDGNQRQQPLFRSAVTALYEPGEVLSRVAQIAEAQMQLSNIEQGFIAVFVDIEPALGRLEPDAVESIGVGNARRRLRYFRFVAEPCRGGVLLGSPTVVAGPSLRRSFRSWGSTRAGPIR